MSRQILSYADLGPVTSITTPIPRPSSPHPHDDDSPSSPPRKRPRTNNDRLPSPDDIAGHAKKRKKLQRPGNPSGVPWTLHWDAQVAQGSHDVNGGEALVYEDEDATMVNTSASAPSTSRNASPRRGGGGQPVSRRNSNKWNEDGGGGANASTRKTMLPPPPPPPPTFIGPVIPPSSTEHGAAIQDNPTGPRGTERNGKGRNGNGNRRGRGTKTKEKEVIPVVANEEEWDDSALIDAWNAAEEEYREMNGGKKWRCEPVKHSSLWHDDFHEDTDEETSDNDDDEHDDIGDGVLQDSLDVMAETVVEESYEVDESGLGHASTQVLFGQASSSGMPLPHPEPSALFGNFPVPVGTTRSSIMEEAFRRAQEASYTAGYWTAIYQMHASQKHPPPPPAQSPGRKVNGVVESESDALGDLVKEEEEGEIEEDGEFLPAQR